MVAVPFFLTLAVGSEAGVSFPRQGNEVRCAEGVGAAKRRTGGSGGVPGECPDERLRVCSVLAICMDGRLSKRGV